MSDIATIEVTDKVENEDGTTTEENGMPTALGTRVLTFPRNISSPVRS